MNKSIYLRLCSSCIKTEQEEWNKGGLCMNQNYNNNEYEILDNGNRSYQTKYPFAQAPGSECQKPNAKDGIYTPVGRVDTVLQNIDIGLSVRTALSILQMLLSVSFPALGRAAGLINIIFGFLWGTLAGQSVWERFMKAVESLVNQKITDAVRAKAISELEGVQNALELYQEAADDWNENPDDASNKERVRRQFTSTNTIIEYAMPSFRVPTFEVPLLTVCAQAANLHLQLLRDAVKFGNEWGMPSEEVEDLYTRLTRRTAEYTDYCVTTYDKGLKGAYNLAPNPTDYNKYPYLNPYSRDPIYGKYYTAPVDWNLFNDFRRDMTIMVLDIVAVWPTYNPRIYTNPYGVQVELSREVYSTVYGRGGSDNSSVEAIESQIVRPPHLVTELTTLKIEQGATLDMEQIQYPKYMKVTNTLHYIGSSSTWEQSSSAIPIRPITQIHTIPANNIGNLSLSQLEVPYRFSFYNQDNALIAEVGSESPPNNVTWNGIPRAEDSDQNSHHLSYVGALSTQSSAGFPGTYPTELLGEWGFGWLHNSLTPANRIDPSKITQIPAVKGFGLGGSATVISGPGSTGGDVVQLQRWGHVKIAIPAARNIQPYRVRIRYASSQASTLRVIRWRGGVYQHAYYNVPQTYTNSLLTYNTFKYVDSFAITPDTSIEVWLENTGGGTIIIDKIEFIPTTPTPEPVVDGIYQIVTALNNSSVAENGGPTTRGGPDQVKLSPFYNSTDQKWEFIYDSNEDVYTIRNLAGGFLTYFMLNPGYPVLAIRPQWATENQKWIVEPAGNGYYYLRSKSVPTEAAFAPNAADGSVVRMSAVDFSTNQKFKLNKL
ncbi:hypothetical protein CUC43_32170 (plasmid) [Bacillus thuringiensis LM1212]|nr:hypothetical protein CUC43_32170 [Bacillus thuringiensis LM1212]QDF27195.1 hypothetical protein FJR70_30775 [Bacillus tropicus]